MRFWTSDFHFGNPNILRYCNRRFRSVERMAEVFINKANMKAKNSTDTIIHVGDFSNYGNEKGTVGSKIKPQEYIDKFKAKVILVEGNHDGRNKVKSDFISCTIQLANSFRYVSVGHFPSNYPESKGQFLPGTLRLCGHVHGKNAWKWYWDAFNKVLNINVGIDHWKYDIVSDEDIINYANRIISKINQDNFGNNVKPELITTKHVKIWDKHFKNMPIFDKCGDLQKIEFNTQKQEKKGKTVNEKRFDICNKLSL